MSDKMGRPPLPKGEAKAAQIGVRFNPQTDKKLNEMAKASGQTKADIVRAAAEEQIQEGPIWVNSKWKTEELDEQFIEFNLHSKDPQGIKVLEGIGRMRIRENPRGKICINVFIDRHITIDSGVTTRIRLNQWAADRIELNPNSERAKFRLIG